MLAHFGVVRPKGEIPIDSYPGYLAPLIRRAPNVAEQESEAKLGRYGLLPAWAKDMALGRRTYNCRSETAATLPSFRDAWRRGQRCIVPAEAIYEPSYETGRAVRWRIGRRDGRPLGIAGLWDWWTNRATGEAVLSFTMRGPFDFSARSDGSRPPAERALARGSLCALTQVLVRQ